LNGNLRLHFRGKGGVNQEACIDDPRLTRIIRRCHKIQGQRLFQYLDSEGQRHPVESQDVNNYIQEIIGINFSAKDFRTWGATVYACELLHGMPLPRRRTQSAFNRCIVKVVKEVAIEMRNTPAVCRKSYINPVVFDLWKTGTFLGRINVHHTLSSLERLVVSCLRIN
jgi:DNA topoisomerase IB